MGLRTRLIVGGAVVGVALTHYVRSRHARTGESYLGIVRSLPEVARSWVDETRDRALKALEEGKVAARRRDEELSRQLLAAGAPPDA